MRKWFLAAAIAVLVLNAGWFVYSEIRTRRVIASLRAEPIETHSHPHAATNPVLTDSNMTTEVTSAEDFSFDESVDEIDEMAESSDELFDELQDSPNESDEECCAEDDLAFTDDWDTLSWDEKIRRKLISKHGDIPEIERYIEFESVYRHGGNLTVAEVLEHLELRVMLYDDSHGMLAQQREIASDYSPDDIVTVKRDYNSKPSGESGTTVTTVVTHP